MRQLLSSTALAILLCGCGNPQGTAPESQGGQVSSSSSPTPTVRRAAGGETRRMEFLNRIRAADPRYQTIERALMNERNEMGIILKRNVDLDDIPKLMRSLLTEMAKEFPGQDLTIVAYAPTEPPRQIGVGRLNARTREMTYTPAH